MLKYKNLKEIIEQLECCHYVTADTFHELSNNTAFIQLKELAEYDLPIDMPRDIMSALNNIYLEFLSSCKKHVALFRSTHEGYAVIQEEVEELWDEVKNDNYNECYNEAVQIGAMALKFILSKFTS